MTPEEIDANPKKAFGALKPSLHYAPMNAMLQVARVFELGAKKYGLKNWRRQPVDASTYYSAAYRHLIEWFESGVNVDPESGQHPLAHVIACCLIVIDSTEGGELIDDRGFAEVLTGTQGAPAAPTPPAPPPPPPAPDSPHVAPTDNLGSDISAAIEQALTTLSHHE